MTNSHTMRAAQRAAGFLPAECRLKAGSTFAPRDSIAFTLLLLAANLHLLHGTASPLTFLPGAVAGGEWWRLVTHPFVHVSWYHLLLDGSAFLLLHRALDLPNRAARLAGIAASAAGSIIAAILFEPRIATLGLCGLSGIAHGLMAIVALAILRSCQAAPTERWLALAALAGLFAKCLHELLTGQAAFAGWHLGSVGTPIAICHAGGLIGALVWWLATNLRGIPSEAARSRGTPDLREQ